MTEYLMWLGPGLALSAIVLALISLLHSRNVVKLSKVLHAEIARLIIHKSKLGAHVVQTDLAIKEALDLFNAGYPAKGSDRLKQVCNFDEPCACKLLTTITDVKHTCQACSPRS